MGAVSPTYWADILESLLSVFCQALDATPQGMPANCFVSQGRPADDCGDLLSVWVARFRPTIAFPTEYSLADRCNDVRMMMDVVVSLRRPCQPTLIDNARSPFPDPSELDLAATNLLVDIQTIWKAAVTAYDAGALFYVPRPVDYVKWGQIIPRSPMGGVAGWDFDLTIDLDECS